MRRRMSARFRAMCPCGSSAVIGSPGSRGLPQRQRPGDGPPRLVEIAEAAHAFGAAGDQPLHLLRLVDLGPAARLAGAKEAFAVRRALDESCLLLLAAQLLEGAGAQSPIEALPRRRQPDNPRE